MRSYIFFYVFVSLLVEHSVKVYTIVNITLGNLRLYRKLIINIIFVMQKKNTFYKGKHKTLKPLRVY